MSADRPKLGHTLIVLCCGMFSIGVGIGGGYWLAFGWGIAMLLLALLMAFARSGDR